MVPAQLPRTKVLSPKFPLSFPRFLAVRTRVLSTTQSSLLNLCRKPEHLQQMHARFILHGLHQNTTLCSKLIDSYSNLGLLHPSKQAFNYIQRKDRALYSAFLRNLAKFGDFETTLLVYQEMAFQFMYPDEETYPFVLESCSCLLDVVNGRKIHGHVVKLGLESSGLVGTALVEMYRRLGHFENESAVVWNAGIKDLSYWNCLISEATQQGNGVESFGLFERMRRERVEPDTISLVNLLRSSVHLGSLNAGKAIHCLVVFIGLCKDLTLNTALLLMYSKFGDLDDAGLLFEKMPERDIVVWNIMISAYSQNGRPEKSMELLRYMRKSGVRPDMFTAIPAITSIRQLKCNEWGKEMHAHVLRNELDCQVSVSNAVIDMYCECDCLDYARKVFDLVANKTTVTWSSMIKGYVNQDQNLHALSLYSRMKLDGAAVDLITVINILPACVNTGALQQVKYIHGFSIRSGLNMLSSVNTALLVSYAKCGCIEMARKLFDEEKVDKDIITWNSMISAYAKHGDWSKCFKLYGQMKQSYIRPDELTFLALLTSCVNSGLVKEGQEVFKEMMETYNCKPGQEHYGCMVDLLGRAGYINEAKELVDSMPFKPDARVWGSLLSACKMHSETNLAEFTAQKLLTMEPSNAGNYISLSNVYAAAGKWGGVSEMRSFLRDKGLKKVPGSSWLEVNGCVHEFRVADRSHPKQDDIYAIISNLELEIKEARDKHEKPVFTVDFDIDLWF